MRAPPNYLRSVFINCPFDSEYKPLFQAITFAVAACGFVPRSALEAEDSGDIRILKILDIIAQCGYGIHDISRTESKQVVRADGLAEWLPRFNMPLEIGLFMGARHFGNKQQQRKNYIIFDTGPQRFQKFISDLAGQDIKEHGWPGASADPVVCATAINRAILDVRNWLTTKTEGHLLPGGQRISTWFQQFQAELPDMATEFGQAVADLSFYDLSGLIDKWLKANH